MIKLGMKPLINIKLGVGTLWFGVFNESKAPNASQRGREIEMGQSTVEKMERGGLIFQEERVRNRAIVQLSTAQRNIILLKK